MKTIKLVLLICYIGVTFNCKAQQFQELNLETNIIGTWILDDDPLIKNVFTTSGKYLRYYKNALRYTGTYSIGTSCKGQTIIDDDDIFLRITSTSIEFGDTICYYINTDSSGVITLSLTSAGRGRLVVFTKQ